MADIIPIDGVEPSDEAPAPREKVLTLGCMTRIDLPPARVLDAARERGMEGVVVLGFTEDGEKYFASTYADGGTVLWLLEKAKKALLSVGDD